MRLWDSVGREVVLFHGVHRGPGRGYGRRHIESEGHFGGKLDAGARYFISETIMESRLVTKRPGSRFREYRHNFVYVEPGTGRKVGYPFTVLVVVDPKHRSIVTAYIEKDVECDSRRWTGGPPPE